MWSRLARVLREAGQDVFTPSLTGIGERAHLASAAVDLATHIADVVNVLRYEDLRDVVLVGHSYGGMVVTGAADREPGRVRTLIYLDAFVPQNGQALVDLAPGIRAALPADGWQVQPRAPQAQGMSDAGEIAWIAARRSPQPARTFTDPLPLEGAFRGEQVYVFCSGYSPSTFAPFAAKTRNDAAWRYHELPTHHYPQVSMPAQTAGVLLNYA